MRPVAKTKAREQHNVDFPAGTWGRLERFCAEEGFSGAGEAVAALLGAWDGLVADRQEVDRLLEEARRQLTEAAAKRDRADQALAAAEQRLEEVATGRGLPLRAVGLFEECLREGVGKAELLGVARAVREARVDVTELVRRFEELGGLAVLLREMAETAQETAAGLRRQIAELEAERARLLQGVDALRKQVVQLDRDLAEARAELARANEEAHQAELYRDATLQATGEVGGYLRDVLAKVPPEAMVQGVAPAVAGAVLRIGVQLHGDMEVTVPPHPASGRIVPFRVSLGELAEALAPRVEQPASA